MLRSSMRSGKFLPIAVILFASVSLSQVITSPVFAKAPEIPSAPPSISAPLQPAEVSAPTQLKVQRGDRSQRPFWKDRPQLMERIRDEREVIVSVRREDIANDRIRFTMQGVGHVARPKDFSFLVSQDYPRLKEVSENFRTVNYEPSTHQLYLVTEALGYQARMVLRIFPVSQDWRSELQWEVVWGHFKGMTGWIGFERVEEKVSEVSISAKYEADELPLPKALMGFALEVVTQKVAERMRSFIEAQPIEPNVVLAARLAARSNQNVKVDVATLPGINSIELPPGFSISVFAHDTAGASQMAFSEGGSLFVASPSTGKIFEIEKAAEAINKNQRAPAAKPIASDLLKPSGVAVGGETLFISEPTRVLKLNLKTKTSRPIVFAQLPTRKELVASPLAIDKSGALFVGLGAGCKDCDSREPFFASIARISSDGKKREVFTRGVRAPGGLIWNEKTKSLYFTDVAPDLRGLVLKDELNVARRARQNFGFPGCHARVRLLPESERGKACANRRDLVSPLVELGIQAGAQGVAYYDGASFPEEFRDQIYVVESGGWSGENASGFRIARVKLRNSAAVGAETFAKGWVSGTKSWGRPSHLLMAPDGSLLVSDEMNGVIYRIRFEPPAEK